MACIGEAGLGVQTLKASVGMKRVEVVVLNWNGWRDTLACITSLLQLNYSNFGLIVVDNGSTDGSQRQIETQFPGIDVLQTGANLGFGGGCNAGIRRALERGADYIWLINSDATVDQNALTELVRVADEHASTGAVGSVLYEVDQPDQIQLWGGGKIQLWSGAANHQVRPVQLDYLSGASMLLRREALEQAGLFDEKTFFMYWEDADLGFRLRQAGWQLAVAERSRIWHKLSASLGKGSCQLDTYFTRSGVRFLRRYSSTPVLSVLMMLGRMLLKRVAMGQLSRAKSVFQGYLSA